MKVSYRTKSPGFTIVEIIVVIVVIGIIAAITVTSYRGAQEQAESNKTINQAKMYIDGLLLWNADAGRPAVSSCIAPSSLITGGVCPSAGGWGTNVTYNAAFNQSLAEYSGINTMLLGRYGSDSPAGLMWFNANYYGDNRGVFYYAVGPNTNCGLPNVLSPNPAYDNLTLLGADYTERRTSGTLCLVEVLKY